MEQLGGIIVIEGSDGTGKETVTKNVVRLLNERQLFGNLAVLTQSFPNYQEFYGRQVRHYLNGDAAPEIVRVPEDIRLDPICASAPYAMDRYWTYQTVMKSALEDGHWFVCDRYYTSNMGHQGSRMESLKERVAFFDRLMRLELEYCQLPQPAAVIILDLPEELRQARIELRRTAAETAGTIGGQVGKADIHEQDPEHMRRAAAVYQQMAFHFGWPLVSGVEDGRELTEAEMTEKVYDAILQQLPIQV